MVTDLGSFIQLCLGREEHCKQISLACVGSAPSIWTTLGLPQPKAVCASQVYTAWAAGCSAGACPKQALRFVHFPGLGRSGSQVICKAQTWLGVRFVPFPVPSSSGDQVLGKRTVPGEPCILITSRVPSAQFLGCTMRAPFQVSHVSPLGS